MDHLSLLIAALIWGGNAIVTKASASVISPAGMAFYRWVLAIALLTPLVGPGLYANRKAVRAQLGRLVVLGLLGCAAFPGLMYIAAQSTSAIHIGIIQSLMPLMVLGLSGQRLTLGPLLGGLLSLTGVVLVVSHGRPAALLSQAPNGGDLIMLASTACYAVYAVLLRHRRSEIPLLQSLYIQAWTAALLLAPFCLLSKDRGLDAANLPLVAYAGGLASIIAPLIWMRGISRIGPARAALFFNLVPVIAVGLAAGLLSEKLDISTIIGGAMTVGGVMVAEMRRLGMAPPVLRKLSQRPAGPA
jgi:drug/metabolite transporter (DMT)-like permease